MTRRRLLSYALSFLLAAVGGCADVVQSGAGGSGGAGGGGGSAGGSGGASGVSGAGGASGGTSGAGGADGGQVDFIVESIGIPSVGCIGVPVTCVTTVDVTIENAGDADAPEFSFQVTFDPSQSLVVRQSVAGGLTAGASQRFTIESPAGGNCFDPDCTVSVVVDDLDQVMESDEDNNTDSITILG